MTSEETLHVSDRLLRKRSLLQRPFYRAWQRGELSRQLLATCSRAYHPHHAAFPKCWENAIPLVVDAAIKSTLEDNIHEELTNLETSPDPRLGFPSRTDQNRELVRVALLQ